MAEGRSYGDHLREARERQGIDLVTMARFLHIRPDIVGAIESADFNKMPAHGYTKNMVRAYARQVGLDESRISSMYATERSAFEGVPLADSRSINLPERGRTSSTERRAAASTRFQDGTQASQQRRDRGSSRRTSDDSKPARQRQSRQAPSSKSAGQGGRFGELVASFTQGQRKHEEHVGSSFAQASMQPIAQGRGLTGSGRAVQGVKNLNWPFMILIAAIALILIIVVATLLNGGRQSSTDVPDIPISGLTDTSATPSEESTQVETAPSSATFEFSVADGDQSWITVYLDGSSTPEYAGVAEGPMSETFQVTGTLRFESANITPVTLTVDGEEVKATAASSGSNYVYTVDFPSILAQWKADHGLAGSDDDGSSSSSASSSSSSSASTSSSSSSSKSSSSA
ncbi:MAG: helix-turn-helix domain-containing protein [Eggerthellaceae bacterium]|nr:helix-turn-helix domain-containing protein [Eggerthellaceae bacterium]